MPEQRYRAGVSIEDCCRACKTDRHHTVIVVDGNGTPLRVACDLCRSEHNYRGGPRTVVMLRNRLRTLEQQVNASTLPDDVKVKLQGYVSGCYGSLTSVNVLFAEGCDQFKGSGSD